MDERPARFSWLLAAAVVTLLFYGLGDYRTLGSHEVYAVHPAQQMLATGDWIVPYYGGSPRLEKPPLGYWVIAAASAPFGRVTTWTARLPAAVCAVLLAWLMSNWGQRWYGRTAGVAAGLVQGTTVFTLTFGRKAEADMLLCLLTTAAMWLIATDEKSPRIQSRRWTAIYALIALSCLIKFQYGPVMVLAPTVLFWIVQRRWDAWRNLLNPAGLLCMVAALTLWPLMLLQRVPEAWSVWRGETFGRAMGELGDREPFWFYAPVVLWMLLPWTPFVIAAVPESFRRAWKERDARERFVWIWFLTVFAIVSLSANKHKHYIMAALPALSLLAGRQIARVVERLGHAGHFRWHWRAFASACATTIGGLGVYLGVAAYWPTLAAPAAIAGGVLLVGGLIGAVPLAMGRLVPAGSAYLVTGLAAYVVAATWILPQSDRRQVVIEFADEVRGESPSENFGVYRLDMYSLLHHLGTPAYRIDTPEQLRERLAAEGTLRIFASQTVACDFPRFGIPPGRVLKRMCFTHDAITDDGPPLVLVELNSADSSIVPASFVSAAGPLPASSSQPTSAPLR